MSDLRKTFAPDVIAAIEQLVDERVAAALEITDGSNGSPWLTMDEGAEYLRVSPRTLQRLVECKRIRTSTIFRRRLIHREELDAYMRATTGEDERQPRHPAAA